MSDNILETVQLQYRDIAINLQRKTIRKSYAAYRMATIVIKLRDVEGQLFEPFTSHIV